MATMTGFEIDITCKLYPSSVVLMDEPFVSLDEATADDDTC
jgi:hypothetical protein